MEVLDNEFIFINNAKVYPSDKNTVSVVKDDKYNGAHLYKFQDCLGFENGETIYDNNFQTIQFVQKLEDGTTIAGVQSEQLVLALIDRIKKLNNVYPSKTNEKQIQGLQMFLDACKERIDDRINRGVMGKLEK